MNQTITRLLLAGRVVRYVLAGIVFLVFVGVAILVTVADFDIQDMRRWVVEANQAVEHWVDDMLN